MKNINHSEKIFNKIPAKYLKWRVLNSIVCLCISRKFQSNTRYGVRKMRCGQMLPKVQGKQTALVFLEGSRDMLPQEILSFGSSEVTGNACTSAYSSGSLLDFPLKF